MGDGRTWSRRDTFGRFFDRGKLGALAALLGEPAAADTDAPQPSSSEDSWRQRLSPDESDLHLARRITFGPRSGDLDRLKRMGREAFLDEQLSPEKIDDSDAEPRWSNLPSLSMTTEELFENYPRPKKGKRQAARAKASEGQAGDEMSMETGSSSGMRAPQPPRRIVVELAQEEMLRAVYSRRQLQEVMVQFWMNHFNIYAFKGPDRWMLTSFERDTIRPHTLGKFEDLLVATAQSPAMLFYLDNWMSSSAKDYFPRRFERRRRGGRLNGRLDRRRTAFDRRGLYAQEMRGGLLEGRRERRAENAPRRRGKQAGKHVHRGINENYGRELMELHTLGVNGGYTQQDVIEVARCLTGWSIDRPRHGGGFVFRPVLHDYGKKVVLGEKFPAGHGIEDGYKVLHLLAHHPATARHISLQLSRRFVADEPPASLVERASAKFQETGGDIRAVVRTILTSPEFDSQAALRAKVKSPLELVAGSLRALDGDTDAGRPMLKALARMGEPMFLYQAPSGYPDRADTWINSGSLLARINFAALLAENRLRGTRIAWERWRGDGSSAGSVIDSLGERLLGEAPPSGVQRAIRAQLEGGDADFPRELALTAGLLMASPEFQRR